jgi:hypothetical protein
MIFCCSLHKKKPGYVPSWLNLVQVNETYRLETNDVHHSVQARRNRGIIVIKRPGPAAFNALGIARCVTPTSDSSDKLGEL